MTLINAIILVAYGVVTLGQLIVLAHYAYPRPSAIGAILGAVLWPLMIVVWALRYVRRWVERVERKP